MTLSPGNYPVFVRARITDADGDNLFLLRFAHSDDYDAELARWRRSLARNRGIFERIIKYRPESDLAAKAGECLEALRKTGAGRP